MPSHIEGTLNLTQVAHQRKSSKEHTIAILPCSHLNNQSFIFNPRCFKTQPCTVRF